jgi:hypothetical protein
MVLDLDATDDPLHGRQKGRFLQGYDDCYCYLPLYVFCGRHLLAAIADALAAAETTCRKQGTPVRRFAGFFCLAAGTGLGPGTARGRHGRALAQEAEPARCHHLAHRRRD